MTDEEARAIDLAIAASLEGKLCEDCPPEGHETPARCAPCPRRGARKGRSQGLCETTLTERFENPDCACETYPDNLGPCKTFEEGASGRCAYCDHEAECHRSLVGKLK